MRKIKIRLTAMALAALLIVTTLAGCGSDNQAGSNPQSTNANANNTSTVAEKKVSFNCWLLPIDPITDAWWGDIAEKFNSSQSNIEVNLTIVSSDAWEQKLKAAQATGEAPEAAFLNYNKVAFQAKQGLLMPMDDYVDPKVWEDIYPYINDFISVNGVHYVVPQYVEPSAILYYRKDMFRTAGLDPEKPPQTWDELIKYGKKLTTDKVFGLSVAGFGDPLSWTSWAWQAMVGHMPINDDWSKATVVDDSYKNLAAFWKKLYDEKIVPKQPLAPYGEITPIAQGRVAMQICGSWAIGRLKSDEFPDLKIDDIGIATVPTPDGDYKKTTATMGGWALGIDGKAQHPQEVADFITYVLAGDTAIMADYFKTSQYARYSCRKSVDDVINAIPEVQNDQWRKLISEKIIPYTIPEPIYAWDISLAYSSAIERIVLKNMDIEASLKQAENEINDYIAKNNYAGTNPKLKK